ncbi:GNAT family N-acetyltransferase [uncultured Sphingobacterium sp.]|uniref:GNAT family N-acetyltransferase n=1 Tax=uncultured Sphingobacterium sp. TaxID=182688 RepID=UPI0025E62817|nr:GNAT family N-acetyltransferase [uncultured Sphingobacterium sp.]
MHFYSKKYLPEDFDAFHDLVKSDDVMKYITGKGLPKEQARKKFDTILEINQDPDLGYFKVIEADTLKLLGDCKLVNYKKDPSVFEIGYLLRKEHWGKGLGTQICESMLALATTLNPDKDVIGIIDPDNTASKRLLNKFGFKSFFVGLEDALATEKLILKRTVSE